MIMLFTSIWPRECLGRAARHNGQFNPVAIEHPMVPEGLCHSFAVRNSVRSADIARVVWFLTAPLLPHGRDDLGLRQVGAYRGTQNAALLGGRASRLAGAGCGCSGRGGSLAGMPTRLVHLVIDATDPPGLARFWSAALGWEIAAEEPGEAEVWPRGYDYPDPVALPLVFVPVPEPKMGKNRIHLDLATTSAAHQAAEVSRVLSLGATLADIGQGEVPWVVLADPEGNEFCVLDPRPVYRDTGPVAAVVADCADPVSMAQFWSQAAGWTPQESGEGFASLRSPSGVGPYLEFVRTPDVKTVKNRMHLDVSPYPGEDHLAEAKRLQDFGAAPADIGQGEVPWVVLADPEGGEFCVLTPR